MTNFVFGNTMKASKLNLLSEIRDGDRVLILGGGTGWFLQKIVELNNVKVDFVEKSKQMIAIAKQRSIPDVTFINEDFTKSDLKDEYDIIISCYFFDLFQGKQLKEVIDKVIQLLSHDGRLLYADFSSGQKGIKNVFHQIFLFSMIGFFKVTTQLRINKLSDLVKEIENKGFRIVKRNKYYFNIIESNVFEYKTTNIAL